MSQAPNPYSSREPVRSAEMFFGRTRELQEIVQFLRGSQSVALDGPEGIGKTSLLIQLMRPAVDSESRLESGHLACYLECGTLAEESAEGIFRQFSAALIREMESRGLPEAPELRAVEASPSWRSFETALRALNRRRLRLEFFLDDFEQLSGNSRIDVSFYNALRSAAGRFSLAFCTTSIRPLHTVLNSAIHGNILSSPFFNIFAPLSIGLLDDSAARELIHAPALRSHQPFSPDMEKFLFEMGGGHPRILQSACFYALESPGTREEIAHQTLREMEPFFDRTWRSMSETQRRMLLNAEKIQNSFAGPDANILRELGRACLLVPSERGIVIPGSVWAEYLRRQSPLRGSISADGTPEE